MKYDYLVVGAGLCGAVIAMKTTISSLVISQKLLSPKSIHKSGDLGLNRIIQ